MPKRNSASSQAPLPVDDWEGSATRGPADCREIFWSFTLMALQAFGGSTAIAQQFLVDQKRWLTQREFLEWLTVAQSLPGPSIMILTLMLGDRYFGFKGAVAAFFGMITVPMTLMLFVFVFYQNYATQPIVASVFVGMAASATGMIFGAASRLLCDIRRSVLGKTVWVVLLAAAFFMVAIYRQSMFLVLPVLGIPATFWAYRQLIREAAQKAKSAKTPKGDAS